MLERLFKMLIELITETNGMPKTVWLSREEHKKLLAALDNPKYYISPVSETKVLQIATPVGVVRVLDNGYSGRIVVSYKPTYPVWEGQLHFRSMPWE